MKKTLLAAVLLLASCSGEFLFEKAGPEEAGGPAAKTERPLWWVLQQKDKGARELAYEDKWYSYQADFDYIKPGQDIFKNSLYGQCPIESTKYKVIDKQSGETVRAETISQNPCDHCHKR